MMNDRIKELAKQAGLYSLVNGTLYPQNMTAEESGVAYERFAELIIKDCQEACIRTGILEQDAATGEMYANAIRERFDHWCYGTGVIK
jgi:hypothetical protein